MWFAQNLRTLFHPFLPGIQNAVLAQSHSTIQLPPTHMELGKCLGLRGPLGGHQFSHHLPLRPAGHIHMAVLGDILLQFILDTPLKYIFITK